MPKVIDNYVLEEKIGSGQFGDVFKGYNQQTNHEVAIKTIKRQTIKGKFYQLLQNQIKVLKTCDNPYIMKMYALKKTANHFYLILEYCNGGDMLGKVKKYKKIEEKQVIKYFCQILTGFQTLVKHKIMHRDFKLANILLHDDTIKIADFGFSKLLQGDDYTTTMLGSPLNMAPQVLGGNKYNNKADIWSIGACIYQMLVGKPPYMASNMVDLLKTINSRPVTFPNDIKINSVLKDVLKKMLTADVKRRINWHELFNHPINRYLDNEMRKQIDLELVEDQSLMINTSKYYLKQNLFVNKIEDIEEKEKVNEELVEIIKTGEKIPKPEEKPVTKTQSLENQGQKSQASCKKWEKQSKNSPNQSERTQKSQSKLTEQSQSSRQPVTIDQNIQKKTQKIERDSTFLKKQSPKKSDFSKSKTTLLTNHSHIYRKNSKILLYYRNIYAFLAAVVDQLIERNDQEQGSQLAGYVILQKILTTIKWLKYILSCNEEQFHKNNIDKDNVIYGQHVALDLWNEYRKTREYADVNEYITRQEDIFMVFAQTLENTVKQKILNGNLTSEATKLVSQFPIGHTYQSINQENLQKYYEQFIMAYIKPFVRKITHQSLCTKDYQGYKNQWKHIEKVLICLNYSQVFHVQDKEVFNFTKFYEDLQNKSPEQRLINVETTLMKFKENKP